MGYPSSRRRSTYSKMFTNEDSRETVRIEISGGFDSIEEVRQHIENALENTEYTDDSDLFSREER